MSECNVMERGETVAGEADAPVDEYRARARFYRLLAGAFAEEPSLAYLAALRAPEGLAALADLGWTFEDDFLVPGLDELHDQVACEYATLFTVTGGFPPVESVRLTGRYRQDPCHAVRDAYRGAGFEPVAGRFNTFEDQLGVELSFVAALLERSADCLEAGDRTGHDRLDKDIRRFWTLHLGRWARGYARLVQQASQHSLFREMARLLELFAKAEIAAMGLKVQDSDGGRLEVPKSEIQVLFNPDEPVCGGCA